MPWKLLGFIAVMTVVLVFVGVNLENRCDISVVFVTFSRVPVVITILASFLFGLLAAFFLALGRNRKDSKQAAAKPVSKPAPGSRKPAGKSSKPFKPEPEDKAPPAESGN